MKQLKRFITFLLALTLLFSLASCEKQSIGGGSKNDSVVLKAKGQKITADTYLYFYNNYKAGDTDASAKELHELALEAISRDVALTLMAKEYNVKLTDDDIAELDSYIQSLIDEKGGEEAYYSYLEENNLTGDLFRHLYSQKRLEEKLREFMTDEYNNVIVSDDKTLDADIEKNFMAAKQILILKSTDNAKSLADEIYTKLDSGEDFDTLMAEYNEDGDVDPEYGRYFTKGMMVSEFEEAVLSLKEDEVYKGVVESSVGYHIIWRLPLDEGYIDDNYETLRYYYQNRRINEMISEKAESIELKKTGKFDSMKIK